MGHQDCAVWGTSLDSPPSGTSSGEYVLGARDQPKRSCIPLDQLLSPLNWHLYYFFCLFVEVQGTALGSALKGHFRQCSGDCAGKELQYPASRQCILVCSAASQTIICLFMRASWRCWCLHVNCSEATLRNVTLEQVSKVEGED